MALAEKLKEKLEEKKSELTEKSLKTKKSDGAKVDSGEWLLLFLAAGFVDLLYVILTIIGLIPIVGQMIYVVVDPLMSIIVTGMFWFYLQHKGLGGYWWLAFGGGLASLIPIVNWISWITSVFILYLLVKTEKIPFAGEVIEKGVKVATKVK